MHYFVIPALIAVIYVFIVRPKIKQYRAVSGVIAKADAAGASGWAKFLARLSGFKTVILGALAALMPQLPPVMDEINSFTGWNVFLGQGLANRTAAVLAAATAVTHVYGLLSAARTIPVGIVDAQIVPGGIVPPALQAAAEKAAAAQASGGA